MSQDVRPPEAPLSMPRQALREKARKGAGHASSSQMWRKVLVGLLAFALSVWATRQMYLVVEVGEVLALEWALLVLFALNICWIAFAFVSASFGFLVVLFRRRRQRDRPPPRSRTAVVFPVYNEDARQVFATLEATAGMLADAAPGAFECFVLSDSTDPDAALLEEAVFAEIKARQPEGCPVFYRRRTINHARKSGNVEDFVSRWGGRYDHFIVFDADSYMSADTLLELVRRMEGDPGAGLIQTIPQLIGGETIFARTQQFASALYGPVLGSGVAFWAQDEGNFWGHNAIIRTRAFAEAAGLPVLPGKAPFGGSILSHDFIEAALLRKRGWRVRIASDLGGSFEECPPSIIDLTIRDRRWCQGNLQHAGVLVRARDLAWTSRLHLIIGIMSYLASPLWLLLILIGMGLSLQGQFLRPDYFGDGVTLFPKWVVIDSARALSLFAITMGILFAPKIYGLVAGIFDGRWRRKVGVISLFFSVIFETLISALLAPVLMAAQTSSVFSILLGRDSGWSPQQRAAGGYPIKDILRRHAWTMVLGVVLSVAAFSISPTFLAWLAPATVGMMLAGPLSILTSSAAIGRGIRRLRLLVSPQESDPPSIYLEAQTRSAALSGVKTAALDRLLTDPSLRRGRAGLVDRHWALEKYDVHLPLAAATAKALKHPGDLSVLEGMSRAERMALLNDTEALDLVAQTISTQKAG